MAKVIRGSSILGQQGINLIQRIVLGMEFVWREKTVFDAGIDGEIEIRDPATGAMSGCILNVQGKARSEFQSEDAESFTFQVDADDLDYWLNGNVPNILVVCRPASDEAFWISIRDYFANPASRKSRKVRFNKVGNRFDANAAPALVALARPKDSGLYFVPPKLSETLYSNLLPVTRLPKTIYVAKTELFKPGQVFAVFKESGAKGGLGEFVLRSHCIASVHNLRNAVWEKICDRSTVESFPFDEWANEVAESRDTDVRNLLGRCLDSLVFRLGMKFCPKDECFYFRQPKDREQLSKTIHGVEKAAPRGLVTRYESGKPKQLRGYKHAAFSGKFRCFDGQWFLEVTPTSYYTTDGKTRKGNSAQLRKGLKQIEKNHSVFGHVNMWSEILAGDDNSDLLRSAYEHLAFGHWKKFECPVSISDAAWRQGEVVSTLDDAENQFLLSTL